jgi:hypothetical protein
MEVLCFSRSEQHSDLIMNDRVTAFEIISAMDQGCPLAIV